MKMSPLFVSKERKNILSKEEVYELLEKYKNGDKSAQDKIVEHNKQMVIDIALSFKNSPYEQQELIAVGLEALLKVLIVIKMFLLPLLLILSFEMIF